MTKAARWLRRIAVGLPALVLLASVVVYIGSELRLRAQWDVPLAELQVPADEASIAEGRRLAQTRGCYNACHADLAGSAFIDDPVFGRVVAPNLTQSVQRYSNAELERAIRHGIGRDGRALLFMPARSGYQLSDADLGRIVAFLRSVPPAENDLPPPRYRLLRALLLLEPAAFMAAYAIDHDAPRMRVPVPTPTAAYGEYVARTTCAGCHEADLRGAGDASPDLVVVKSYSLEQFTTLMRTGVPVGGGELGLMKMVAKNHFSAFNDTEIAALHSYLQTLGSP